MRLPTSFARAFCAAAIAALALLLPLKPAQASDYTDLWVAPFEDAWGVNFVQWGGIIYATLYIYGPDNLPLWYSGVLNRDALGNYSGTLFINGGTYFAAPWNPNQIVSQVAGTANFTPSQVNDYMGTLTYTVNGVGTIIKSIQRFSDHPPIPLAGNYYGAESGAYSSCTNSGDNTAFVDTFPLTVTQTSNALTLVFEYEGLGTTCTLTGPLVQNGTLYSVPGATYVCTDGLNTTATIFNVKQTAQGIEGQFSAPVPGNCRENTRFSAVRN